MLGTPEQQSAATMALYPFFMWEALQVAPSVSPQAEKAQSQPTPQVVEKVDKQVQATSTPLTRKKPDLPPSKAILLNVVCSVLHLILTLFSQPPTQQCHVPRLMYVPLSTAHRTDQLEFV